MERAKLLEALQFEAQFQAIKQECNANRLLEVKLKEMQIPVEYMPAIQSLLNYQEAELCSRMMVFFKQTLDKVVLSFVINNPRVNGYANDVVQMLRRNLVNNPEGNLTNQLANDTEEVAGHLANLKVKVEQADQDSTETVTQLNSSNDHHQSQSSAHTKDKAKSKKKLSPDNHSVRGRKVTKALAAAEPETVKPTCPESRNNEECNQVDTPGSSPAVTKPKSDLITDKAAKPVISQQTTLLSRMRKRLYNLGRSACMVKGCSQTFVSTNINIKIEDHIKKDHKKDKQLPCTKCPERFLKYDRLMEHYLMQHLGHYKCSVANCGFTSDVRAQVTNHYCEHDDHTEEGEAINHGLTVQSPLASECIAKEPSPVVAQQPSTSSQPSTMKRSSPEPRNNNEQFHQVDGQGQSSSSAKKAKLNSTRSNNAQSQATTSEAVKHNSTEETHQNEMFIIVGLKCCQLNCQETFSTEAERNHHMLFDHSISAFSCMIWGCGRSFNNRRIREDHVMKDHPNLSMWRCVNCPKRFESHWSLYRHYSSEHRHQYQCALANCAFTSESRDIISRHYVREHDTTTKP